MYLQHYLYLSEAAAPCVNVLAPVVGRSRKKIVQHISDFFGQGQFFPFTIMSYWCGLLRWLKIDKFGKSYPWTFTGRLGSFKLGARL
jgi:hypothetical protein